MTAVETSTYTEILERIKEMPINQQLTLVQDIMQVIKAAVVVEESAPKPVSVIIQETNRKASSAEVRGAWKVGTPPTDEEVKQIIEQARLERYGYGSSFNG